MTEKLYYRDGECREFTARVLSCSERGGAWEAVLDRSAVFPGGGGQEAVSGTVAGMDILSVREEDETI